MAEQTITLNLPEAIYQRVKRTAEALKRPLDEIVAESLNVTLPPLDDIAGKSMNDLRAQAQASFDPNKQARLSALLELNKAGQITPEQEREMDDLLAQAYELAAKKARASRLFSQFSPS